MHINPTKMCIKSAPYSHQKSANWALNVVLFYALVLMLLFKLVLNAQIFSWVTKIKQKNIKNDNLIQKYH